MRSPAYRSSFVRVHRNFASLARAPAAPANLCNGLRSKAVEMLLGVFPIPSTARAFSVRLNYVPAPNFSQAV
eukprot:402947-Pyramimonas_sp.AAC.1